MQHEAFPQIEGMTFREYCQSLCDHMRRLDPRYDWIGIYWLEGDTLVLGPWSGNQATEHTKIPICEGICGAAVREMKTIIVDDVQKDSRYLSCFFDTRSEIVVPIHANGQIIGEIDIDGKETGAFGRRDQTFLEALAHHIGEQWPGQW